MKRRMQGVFYAEVLLAVAIVAVALVPAVNAIYAGVQSSDNYLDATAEHFSLVGRMEELRAETYSALDGAAQAAGSPDVATSYSDPAGPGRRLVYLSRYDADDADSDNDPFTGTEPDLLWLRIEIEGTDRGFETLRAK